MLHYESHHLDLTLLADSVHSFDGLVLDSRVPPWVHQEDFVGCDQVQPHSSGFERGDEYLDFWIFLEGLHYPCSFFVRSAALHPHIGYFLLLEVMLYQIQHSQKLRKYDYLIIWL